MAHRRRRVYDAPALRSLRGAPDPPDYGTPPAQTSLAPPPEHTPEKFIGEVALPAPVVDDGHDLEWKLKHSPFYVLRRYTKWVSKYQSYDGYSTTTYKDSYTEGVEHTTSETIEKKLNLSITYTCGFSLKGLSAQLSTTLSAGLAITTTDQWVTSYSHLHEYFVKYPSNKGHEYIIATWHRVDVYRLLRVPNGTTDPTDETLNWEVVVPGAFIARSFGAPDPIK
ncbi:hypothetical protein ACQEU6_24555 [Spirillospora sp. CA-108201]